MKKMTFFYVTIILTFLRIPLLGQSYNQEWIDYEQEYTKIKVAQNGWYKIPYKTLITSNLPLSGNGFQLFHEGKQIPISVSTMDTFSEGDYIEFYGEKNTGKLDAQLFSDPNQQLSSSHSLFTDTAIYFLTWAETGALYFQEVLNNLDNIPTTTLAFAQTNQLHLEEVFFQGTPTQIIGENFHFADFESNESFVSNVIERGDSRSFTLSIPALSENSSLHIDIPLIGQADDPFVGKDHKVAITINGFNGGEIEFSGFEKRTYQVDFPSVLLDQIGQVELEINNMGNTEQSAISIANIQVNYQRTFDVEGQASLFFELDDQEEKYLEIYHFDGEEEAILYDLSNHQQIKPKLEGDVYKIHLPQVVDAISKKRSLFLLNSKKAAIFEVQNMTNITFINYANQDQQGDYILLTHPSLMSTDTSVRAVQHYQAYRTSKAGGHFKPVIVDIQQLYDQFAFGVAKHPLSIRNFINFAVDQWTISPKYLFIVGKGISYPQIYKNSIEFANCLVPTYGDFPSDHLLTARNAHSYQPQLAVGRINARTSKDVQIYLAKVIEYEQMQSGTLCADESNFWLKNALFLAQHPSSAALTTIQEYFSNYATQIKAAPYGANVLATLTQTDTLPQSFPQVANAINHGVGLIHYFGRTVLQGDQDEIYWNFDIQSPDTYDHPKRYPFILSQGSGTIQLFNDGNFTSMAEDFTLAPNGGAIAFFGLLDIASTVVLDWYNTALYQQFAQDHYGQSFGQAVQNAIASLYIPHPINSTDKAIKSVCQQLMLSGDPALSIGSKQADYALAAATTVVDFTFVEEQQLTININANLFNNGKATNDLLPIHIYLNTPDGNTELIYEDTIEAVVNITSFHQIFTIPIIPIVGEYTLSILLDEPQQLAESCEINNSFTQTFTINCEDFPPSSLSLPDVICQSDPILTLTNPSSAANLFITSPTLEQALINNRLIPSMASIGAHEIFYINLDNDCNYSAGMIDIVEGIQIQIKDTIFPETPTILDFFHSPTIIGTPIAYLWSDGSSDSNIHIQSIGKYSVTVTNEQGCTAIDSFIVNYENNILACPPPIDFNAIANSYCIDNTPISLPDPSINGVFASNTLSILDHQLFITTDQIGVHELSFTYNNNLSNCQYDTLLSIEILPTPTLDLGEDQQITSENNLTLNAGEGWNNYQWSTGDTTTSLTITETGTYALTVTNHSACTATDVIKIGIGEEPIPNHNCLPFTLQTTPLETICPNINTISLTNIAPVGLFSSPTLQIENQQISIDHTSAGAHELHYIFEDADNLCAFDTTLTINILDNTTFFVHLGNDTTILAGNTLTLTADLMDEHINYQWSTGAITPNIEVTEAGIYSITITHSGACSISDNIVVNVEEEMVGIPTVEKNKGITAYPNPTTNAWTIVWNRSTSLKQAEVDLQLFDIHGRLVLTQKMKQQEQIRADFLPIGTYLLQLTSDRQIIGHIKLCKVAP